MLRYHCDHEQSVEHMRVYVVQIVHEGSVNSGCRQAYWGRGLLIRLDVEMKIANEVSKNIDVLKSTQLCGLTGVRLQLAVPPVQYERRIVRAGFCGGFVAQWFMTDTVRHPGFESRSCRFFALLLSPQAG